MTKTLDIGIVNFNGGAYLRKCVLSALAQVNAEVRVFVYDNASTDGSIETIADLGKVKSIRGTVNKGYAFACNRLIEVMTSDLVVVSNMDLEFDGSWAKQVIAAFEAHPEADSIASLVLEQTDPVTVNFAGMGFFPDLHPQSIYAGARPEAVPQSPAIVFGAYGAVMVFRRSLFDKIGFFDEDYFLFYEETEFFWRMNIYGRKTVYWPQAKIVHFRSLTTRRFSLLKLYYTERNRIYTGLKILPIRRYPSLFIWSLYRLFLMRGKADPSQKEKMRETGASPVRIIVTIAKAWLSALLSFPAIRKKRRSLWAQAQTTPSRTVEIHLRYRIPWKTLSLR
jgi:GT2 family glycosyltransferase